MKLMFSAASPYVRKVRMTLIETGQDAQVELVPVATTPTQPAAELSEIHPTRKIPALIRPEGRTLYDSRVINRFLDARAGTNLYPEDLIWEVLTLEATGDAIMDAATLIVYEGRCRPDDKQDRGWIEAQWGKVANALDTLNQRWMDHLAGPLDAGQISVGCALGYLDFRHNARNWRKGRDALDDWFAVFSQRDSFAQTAPVG